MIVEVLWNGENIKVEKEWLDRAKQIVLEDGIEDPNKITRRLEEEMGLPEFHTTPLKLILIAVRDGWEDRLDLIRESLLPQ